MTRALGTTGTGSQTSDQEEIFESDSKSLPSISDGDGTESDATVEVRRSIGSRRVMDRKSSGIGSAIITGIRERTKKVWGSAAQTIHPLVVTESIFLGELGGDS